MADAAALGAMSLDEAPGEKETVVDPWTVTGKVDYAKLIRDFGSQPISEALIARFERVTGAVAHPWLKRGIFFEVCRGALPSLTALSSPPPSATSQFAVGESVIK